MVKSVSATSGLRWLLFLPQLPAKPDYARVKLWRRLQPLGVVAIRNAVYVLPNTPEAREDLEWVGKEVEGDGGTAVVCEAAMLDGISDADLESRFRERADVGRLALVGHSLGGYTVLGLGGAWPSWWLPEVKAIVALSPYALPYYRSDGLARLKAPVMYQTGSLDAAFSLGTWDGGYGPSPAPKFLVEIDGAAHLAWTDFGRTGREAIVGHAIAFLDHYTKGAPAGPALKSKLPGVASFRSELPAR